MDDVDEVDKVLVVHFVHSGRPTSSHLRHDQIDLRSQSGAALNSQLPSNQFNSLFDAEEPETRVFGTLAALDGRRIKSGPAVADGEPDGLFARHFTRSSAPLTFACFTTFRSNSCAD